MTECLNCNKEIQSGQYCSNKCQQDFQYKEYIIRWKAGEENGLRGKYLISKHLQRYLFEKYNNKCCECGWAIVNPFTKRIPLEIDHIDGNYLNNTEENLKLLCPCCHALTSTYKNANKGNGRKGR